jgi:hypothetical protein
MFVLSPNDNKVNDDAGALKDRNFSGNRKVTDDVQKSEDYTKPSLERRANIDGDAEEKLISPDATMDVDDLNDPQARKRETSRRAETSTTGYDQDSNPYRRPGDSNDKTYSDADNRPKPDTRSDDDQVDPDPNVKHGTRNPWRIGEDYDKPADQNLGADQKPR